MLAERDKVSGGCCHDWKKRLGGLGRIVAVEADSGLFVGSSPGVLLSSQVGGGPDSNGAGAGAREGVGTGKVVFGSRY